MRPLMLYFFNNKGIHIPSSARKNGADKKIKINKNEICFLIIIICFFIKVTLISFKDRIINYFFQYSVVLKLNLQLKMLKKVKYIK